MFTSKATVTTNRASGYLQQLCKHFEHKIEVQFDTQTGQIKFPFGSCVLAADQEVLELVVAAKSQPDLAKTCRVIASHLERFAFRENPTINWQPSPESTAA